MCNYLMADVRRNDGTKEKKRMFLRIFGKLDFKA